MKGLYSKRCWIGGELREATIMIRADKISSVILGPLTSNNSSVTNYKNAVIMPGAIDAHVHINEPGRTEWEGFETATAAAAAGGITTVVDMPLNSSPVTTTVEAYQEKIKSGSLSNMAVNCGLYGGLIPNNANKIEALINCGVLGIKCFLAHSGIDDFPNIEENELATAMTTLARHQIPLLVHCELIDSEAPEMDKDDSGNYQKFLLSRPKRWENKAIDLMINMCERYNVTTHIVHVSSAEALKSISDAKLKALPLTAETCPHYMYFNSDEIPNKNTLYKCAPPIRDKTNNQLLKESLSNGVLDFITSDHSPVPPSLKSIKSGDLIKAWGGISSLQYLLSASWTSLCEEMSLESFIPLLTENPATFLGIDNRKGSIKDGMDADLTVWEPEQKFRVKKEDNLHKHKISPYLNEEMIGKIKATYVNGHLAYNGEIINKKGGKWIRKK